MDRTPEEIMAGLLDKDELPTVREAIDLCNRVIEADRLEAKRSEARKELLDAGWCVMGIATGDDDCETLVPPTDDEWSQ